MEQRNRIIIVCTSIVILFIAYIIGNSYFEATALRLMGLLFIILGYITGILGVLFSTVIYFITFVLSLPIISTISGYLSFVFVRIPYILLSIVVKNTLRRMEGYRNLELRVKNSRGYVQAIEKMRSLVDRSGVKRPKKIKFFGIINCKACKKEIPADGKFCPYCGERL